MTIIENISISDSWNFNYNSIKKKAMREIYFRLLFDYLSSRCDELYSVNEKISIFKVLRSNKMYPLNIGSFITFNKTLTDPYDRCYREGRYIGDYVHACAAYLKRLVESGCTEVVLNLFFVYLAVLFKRRGRKKITEESLSWMLIALLSDFCYTSPLMEKSPLIIHILDGKIFDYVVEKHKLNITYKDYAGVIRLALKGIIAIRSREIKILPQIKVVHTMYTDVKHNVIAYLTSVAGLYRYELEPVFKNVEDFSSDNAPLRAALEETIYKSKFTFYSVDDIMLEIHRIAKESYVKTYYDSHTLTDELFKHGVMRGDLSSLNADHIFIPLSAVSEYVYPAVCDLVVECKDMKSIEDVDLEIGAAMRLGIIRKMRITDIRPNPIRIILNNVMSLDPKLLKSIKTKKKKIEDTFNTKIYLLPVYDKETCKLRGSSSKPEYLRIISDIHYDNIMGKGYQFNFGTDFVVNCGDTASNCVLTEDWVRTHIKRGVFVTGNHLGYSQPYPELNGPQNIPISGSYVHRDNTRNRQIEILGRNLAQSKNIRYLARSVYEYDDMIFIGCHFPPRFLLYGKEKQEECMDYARIMMNDYRLVKFYTEYNEIISEEYNGARVKYDQNNVYTLDPSYDARQGIDDFKFINDACNEYARSRKPIIVVTHTAPLPYSLDARYKGDLLNAAFAHNLTEYIRTHEAIRLWCHGHVHHEVDYIYNRTRFVCCPFGYNNENNFDLPYNYGKRIKIEDIKSKKSWEVLLKDEIKANRVKVINGKKSWYQ